MVIHADQGKQTSNRNIYGHFSERLGRSIYEGVWAGEDSSIPNTRGIRNDEAATLKQTKVPVLNCALIPQLAKLRFVGARTSKAPSTYAGGSRPSSASKPACSK